MLATKKNQTSLNANGLSIDEILEKISEIEADKNDYERRKSVLKNKPRTDLTEINRLIDGCCANLEYYTNLLKEKQS